MRSENLTKKFSQKIMNNHTTNRRDFWCITAVTSTFVLVCTSFALVFSVEDSNNYRACVERASTKPAECALIIYGR